MTDIHPEDDIPVGDDPERVDLGKHFDAATIADLERAMGTAASVGRSGVGTLREPVPAAAHDDQVEAERPIGWWEREMLRILPAWCQDQQTLRQTVAQARAVTWNRTKFHGVRSPLYLARFAFVSGYGLWVGGRDALHYMLAREYVEPIKAAKKAKDHPTVLAHRDSRKQVKGERMREKAVIASLIGGTGYVGMLVVTALLGHWIVAGPMLAALLAAFAIIGHKDRRTDDDSFSLLDLVPAPDGEINETRLSEAVRNTGVIAKNDPREINIIGLIGRTATASVVTFDLPPGITATALLGKLESFASALGKGVGQLDVQTFPTHSGRVSVHISDELPFTEEIEGGPLLELVKKAGQFDLFGKTPAGITLRGLDHLIPSLVGESLLIGGEPGGGKSVAAFCILLAAILDPSIRLWLVDGKGIGGNLKKLAPLADVYDDTRSPAAFSAILNKLEEEMNRRIRLLNSLGEEKATKKLASKYPELAPLIFFIDELKEYTNHFDPATAKEFKQRLISLVSLARATGIITVACTQKPSTDVVPSSLRDLFTFRWALRCATPEASKTIIKGGHGFSAHTIESEQKGAGFIHAGGKSPLKIRSHYYTTAQIVEIVAWATELRQKAGTLPASTIAALTGILVLLRKVFEVSSTTEMRSTDIALLLDAHHPAGGWGQKADETPRAYATRVGARLGKEIEQALGRKVDTASVVGPDGKKGNGYRLIDLA